MDLPIGKQAWLLPESQRPATRQLALLKRDAKQVKPATDALGDYFELAKGNIYLLDLEPYLSLPLNINGRATGKSSIGRLDVITRLLTDNGTEYDVVKSGYDGQLHLLVLPQTFSIRVGVGHSLNQLRLFSGAPASSAVDQEVLGDYGIPCWHILNHVDKSYVPWDTLLSGPIATGDPSLFDMTVDLGDPAHPHIYKALASDEPIDLRSKKGTLPWDTYFERVPVHAKHNTNSVVLNRNDFYIMKSRERLCIPRELAVEVVAISERIGDIRIHYAGFAHPGFGLHDGAVRRGTPLIFEVRATDMATRLYDGSLLAKMQLFRMSHRSRSAISAYDQQELKLSNVFMETT